MNRRDFFSSLGAVAIAPIIPTLSELLPSDAVTPTTTRYVHRTIGIGFAIHDDVLGTDINRLGRTYVEHLARSLCETKETLTANVLNGAFNVTPYRKKYLQQWAEARGVFGFGV